MKSWVLGATGAIGKELLALLLADDEYSEVNMVTRRMIDKEHPKLKQHIVEFNQDYQLPVSHADVVFIAFGTTLKQAGSKEKQFEIDVEIPLHFLKKMKEQGVMKCVVVSALGVSEKSPFFYSRMKAALDKGAEDLNFDQLILVKPSVLDSTRLEERRGEKVSIIVGNFLAKLGLFRKYRPIKVEHVAQAMLMSLDYASEKKMVYESSQLHDLAGIYRKEKRLV
jgi:uncharacterized protein YbjT (DUF2867 family)